MCRDWGLGFRVVEGQLGLRLHFQIAGSQLSL